ncbi:MAG: hypothetical protein F4107_12295 [Gemmatimonadetes bacterium]|nr:hypothetical protein [Gemmatimonadota bacterium]MYD13385.1 hypothetical protein [Gemmatimonadota bacterium]MYI66692.1 hypothetical protein [Gemmatimonadota bacterium]
MKKLFAKPWRRLPDESAHAYRAFLYCVLTPGRGKRQINVAEAHRRARENKDPVGEYEYVTWSQWSVGNAART